MSAKLSFAALKCQERFQVPRFSVSMSRFYKREAQRDEEEESLVRSETPILLHLVIEVFLPSKSRSGGALQTRKS